MGTLKRRTQLSEALNEIDMRIHSKLGADEIMQSALDSFVEVLGADMGDIKLREGDTWVVRFETGFGTAVVGETLAQEHAPVAARVAQTGEPVAIRDYLTERDTPYVGFPKSHGLRAGLAMPLVIRDEVAGCLFAWMKTEPRTFSPGEVDFARRMAASVALALENARLLKSAESARRQAEEAERLLRVELERTTVLLRASDELASTIELDELLERVALIVLEATGISRAFVNLIDIVAQTLTPGFATGGLTAPHGDVIPFGALSETARGAIEGGRTALLDYATPGLPEADRRIAGSNGARLVLFVPLVHQDMVVGHISIDEPNERYEFTEKQIEVVEAIAAQASVAVSNAQLFAREHRIAETLQQALLSPPEPVDGVQVACLYQPASTVAAVGGDFYDVLDLGDGKLALLIGDVSGKGLEAARLTALVRDGARAYLQETVDAGEVIARLNAMVHRFTPVDKFTTAFLGILDRHTGALQYSGGGQPCPVIMGPRSTRMLEAAPGLLGAYPDAPFTVHATTLYPDEMLVLVTDGITDTRRDANLLGETGLAEMLDSLRGVTVDELPGALLGAIVEHSSGQLHDDIAILCVKLDGDAEPQ